MKDKELDESHLLIQQHEAKMRSMLESIKELEEKKRTLEKTQDSLNEELVKLRAQGNFREDLAPYLQPKQTKFS